MNAFPTPCGLCSSLSPFASSTEPFASPVRPELADRAAALGFSRPSAPAVDTLPPGLVKDQPTTGRFVKTDQGYMVAYEQSIPGTDVKFQMQPIPGGKFLLGSPDNEPGRKPDEGPQIEVAIDPFWMSTYEVTWTEYRPYMAMYVIFKKLTAAKLQPITPSASPRIVTAPSSLYDPTFTFKLGDNPKQPAVTMSQFAAKQYTKWLSGITGQYFRLPTEAEWEFACRAPVPPPHIHSAAIPNNFAIMAGSSTTPANECTSSARKSPTPGACSTSTATSANGSSTNTRPTATRD